MSDATMRAAIKARLDAMGAAIGRVHDYERWSNNMATFLQMFQDPATKKIFGWEITRKTFRVKKIAMQKYALVHGFVIRGYYGLEDAAGTEKAVNALVDRIVLDFGMKKLTGTQGEQLPKGTIEPRVFGNILCHVPEIELPEVAEIVSHEELAEALTGIDLDYYVQPDEGSRDAFDTINFEIG